MTIESLNDQLMFANGSLYIGSMVLGYQVTAKIIDRFAPKILKIEAVKTIFSLMGLITAAQLSINSPPFTFLSLCITYVALSILPAKSQGKAALPSFMRDLVEEAKLKKDCYYSGHEKYISELEVILCQQIKTSGILVGPPGVGKSAIFETIAWKIAHGKFPENSPFANKRIIEISVTDLVGGNYLVGNLELKIKKILKLAKNDPTVVFFIDEIHKIIGAGSGMYDRNNDIANQLKPDLARGLTIFGAATPKEFTDYFEKDKTIERRFKKVDVLEPESKECLEMLQNRREQGYFNHNGQVVTITDEAFKAAIFFSKRDNEKKFLPDVANDLLDSVRARAIWHQINPEARQVEITITHETIIAQHASDTKRDKNQLIKQFDTLLDEASLC